MGDSAEHPPPIKYLILQTTAVPSLPSDLLVLTHLIYHWKKEVIKSAHNHVFVYLTLASCLQKTIDVPFLLYYLRWGISLGQNLAFCIAWSWLDYSLISCLLHLLARFSIERHLFVFHSQLMKKTWTSLLFHHFPLLICSIYAPLFYFIVIFFPTKCVNRWNYEEMFCGGACYVYNDAVLITFDWLFHYALPVWIIFLANVLLLCRVIWQKVKLGRPMDWRRHRWMILQLVHLSILCLTLQSPATIVGVIEMLWLPTFAYNLQTNYLFYITYFLFQFLPIAILGSLPELHKDIRRCMGHVKRSFAGGTRIHPGLRTTRLTHNRDTIPRTA